MRFAKWVFLLAGISGVLMVAPGYILEEKFGQDYPPIPNHLELYYGFIGVTLAWQFMFLVIASDPIRYRPAMLPSFVEKAGFAVAVPILYSLGKVSGVWLGFAAMDGTWLVLFVIAYLQTPKKPVAHEGNAKPS
jgi:hypothetical protein